MPPTAQLKSICCMAQPPPPPSGCTELTFALLKVNLSPNLSSTRHKPLAALFSNVVNDLVRLVGFGPGEASLFDSEP